MSNLVKKAAVLTWCGTMGPMNYGQLLQCYAMQRKYEKEGYNTQIILYRKLADGEELPENASHNQRIEFERKVWDNLNKNIPLQSYKKFLSFIDKYINLSVPCYSIEMLEEITHDCEILVCGSDQIWGPYWFDPVWFLDFGDDLQKRIAYATSGIFYDNAQLSPIYKKMGSLLNRFDSVGVREACAVTILEKYTDVDISCVVDPTLCMQSDEWGRLAAERLIKEDYLFFYVLGGISSQQLIIRELMMRYKVKTVICVMKEQTKAPYKYMRVLDGIGPCEFLSLVRYAKAVCTDSFHGTIMSYQFGVPFYNVSRHGDDNGPFGGKSRILNLYNQLCMSNRYVRNVKQVRDLFEIYESNGDK